MQSFTDCSVRLFIGRPVTLHNAEAAGDWPGKLIGITPRGGLVECDDGVIRGADWAHIDLAVTSDEIEAAGLPDQTDANPIGVTFPIMVGDPCTGCTDPSEDWIEGGTVVEVCRHGLFIKAPDTNGEAGERVYGIPFDCILIDTSKHRPAELVTAKGGE